MNKSDPKIKLSKAIKHFGGVRPLAKCLEVSPEAVYKRVRNNERYLSSLMAYRLSKSNPELVEKQKASA